MRKPLFVFFLISLSFFISSSAFAELKLGVVAPRGPEKTILRWQELASYLEKEVGEPVKIVPLTALKMYAAASNGDIDLVFSHSPHTVFMQEKLHGKVLATVTTKVGPQFAGIILAKKGSGITKSEDLIGKRVMSLKSNVAAGAYIFQTYHLLKKGINPHKDFASFTEGKTQDELVYAVRDGRVDAAFVRTGLLGAMAREGKVRMSDFVVVDRQKTEDFPLARTTDLYPEWCVTALQGVAGKTAEKIKQALLKLKPEMPAAQDGHIRGFVEPVSLASTMVALQKLKLAPYDKDVNFALSR